MAGIVSSAFGLKPRKRRDLGAKAHFLVAQPLELERVGSTDSFKSIRLYKPAIGPGVFGGQVAAQAAWAATQTVDPVYSLHSYFLTAGDARRPIVYDVERLRDGRSYATRRVKAIQDNRSIFVLECSFHREDQEGDLTGVPTYTPTMPSYELEPEEGMNAEDKVREVLHTVGKSAPKALRDKLATGILERMRMPVELINAMNNDDDLLLGEGSNRSLFWIRTRGPFPSNPGLAKAALIYASDLQVTFVVTKAQGLHAMSDPPIGKGVTLDHSVHFYCDRDFDPSEWILYEMECPIANDGRGIARGRLWTRDGKLLAIVSQEALVRALKPGMPRPKL